MSKYDDGHDERPEVHTRSDAGSEAIKWSAIVLIVVAVLYFLARYVIPLFS